jgi:hypothetical protein
MVSLAPRERDLGRAARAPVYNQKRTVVLFIWAIAFSQATVAWCSAA